MRAAGRRAVEGLLEAAGDFSIAACAYLFAAHQPLGARFGAAQLLKMHEPFLLQWV